MKSKMGIPTIFLQYFEYSKNNFLKRFKSVEIFEDIHIAIREANYIGTIGSKLYTKGRFTMIIRFVSFAFAFNDQLIKGKSRK